MQHIFQRIFQQMLHSAKWKRIASTNHFFIYFLRDSAKESFFLSRENLFLKESLNPANGGFFSLMETVTLLESFFLPAETVTAVSGNQFFLKKILFLLVETDFFGYRKPFFSYIFQGVLHPN